MLITIEMFPAENGDSFLISFGSGTKKNNILIDSGYENTFNNYIKKRLKEIAEKGNELDLFVVTHIHSDHINGAILFLENNNNSINPKIIKINEIWHNSFKHLQFDKINKESDLKEKEILKRIINRGYPEQSENTFKLISAKEGSSLSSLILSGKYNWNKKFDGQAVSSDNNFQVELNNDIKITLLSPDKKKLNDLKKDWQTGLNNLKYGFTITEDKLFDDAFEFMLLQKHEENKQDTQFKKISQNKNNDIESLFNEKFIQDGSNINGSSISFIIEYQDKKMLFLGDSHPDIIIKNLNKLIKNGFEPFFECIKISHHGSDSNTNDELLAIIDAKKYIIATNGSIHNHPDLVMLARLLNKKSSEKKEIIFNYYQKKLNFLNDEELKKKYNYSVLFSDGTNSTIIKL